MSGEVSYHAVENSKLSKPDVMELLQYPIGVTLEADGRYRVFLGAYRFWYLRECLHWTKSRAMFTRSNGRYVILVNGAAGKFIAGSRRQKVRVSGSNSMRITTSY